MLGTGAEEFFDRITGLAVELLGVPTVAFSLVDDTRQFIKSAAGAGQLMTPGWDSLNGCLCPEVVKSGEEVVVTDTLRKDEDPALVTVRAYAGVPLRTAKGQVLGALCALDSHPRNWTEHQLGLLRVFGAAVMSEVQRRIAERGMQDLQLRVVAERTLAHAVQQQMPVGFIVAEVPSGRLVSVNAQMTEIFRTAFKPAEDLNGYRELVGFAADGFPIYTSYGHTNPKDATSPLKKLRSSYRLKKGNRPGGPSGTYDGRFTEDFEYVQGSGDLDECNGRFGVTPEYPCGIYHYYITEEFPYISRLFRGTPDPSFEKRGGPGPRRPPRAGTSGNSL